MFETRWDAGNAFQPSPGPAGKMGTQSAALKTLFYNLSALPVIIVEMKLVKADSGEIVIQQDALTHRIDSNDRKEIELSIGSPEAHHYEPPSWSGQIIARTVRDKVFSSKPFRFSDLIKKQ